MPQQPLRSNFIAKNVVGAGRPKTITGTSYILELRDQGLWLRLDYGFPGTLTIPPESDVDFPINAQITLEQSGLAGVTLTAGAGVTLNAAGGALITNGQFAVVGLTKVGSNEWTAFGNLTT